YRADAARARPGAPRATAHRTAAGGPQNGGDLRSCADVEHIRDRPVGHWRAGVPAAAAEGLPRTGASLRHPLGGGAAGAARPWAGEGRDRSCRWILSDSVLEELPAAASGNAALRVSDA